MTLQLVNLADQIDPVDALTSHPLNRDLVAWYLAGVRPQAQTWYELTRFRRNGTLAGTSVASDWSGPYVREARNFSFGSLRFSGGTTNRVEAGTWGFSGPVTVCCWSRLTAIDVNRDDRFISKADGGADSTHDWMIGHQQIGATDQYRFRAGRNAQTLLGGTGTRPSSQVNRWMHLCGTHEAPTARIYINGTETNNSSAFTNAVSSNANLIYIGNQPTATTQSPSALLDDLRVWNRRLSAEEVRDVYRDALTGYRNTLRRQTKPTTVFLRVVLPKPNKIGLFDTTLRADSWFDAGFIPEGMFDYAGSQTHELIFEGVPPEPPTVSVAALMPASHVISPFGPQ